MKSTPFFSTSITSSTMYQWMGKEEGSFEDHGKPVTGHVYNVLKNSPKGKIVCNTRDEAVLLFRSASYQTTWDSDDPGVIALEKKADKVYKELNRILGSSLL